nr:hypothetical protein [uncultured Rhodopila sp.]
MKRALALAALLALPGCVAAPLGISAAAWATGAAIGGIVLDASGVVDDSLQAIAEAKGMQVTRPAKAPVPAPAICPVEPTAASMVPST